MCYQWISKLKPSLFTIFTNTVIILLLFITSRIQLTVTAATSSLITRNLEEDNVPLYLSEAVQGTIGHLPCNVTSPIIGDRVILVIWYKEGHTTPIYSLDARDVNKEKDGQHWSDNKTLGERAKFITSTGLLIQRTQNTDSGVYKCRVDFHKSPTRNSRVKLSVIIPPEKLLILDEKGFHIPHYILGPYNEDTSVNITCVSTGGRPLPNVTWWHENTLLDVSSNILSDKRVSNVLKLDKLKRNNLNMVLTCQASNNNVTTPISSSVTLDMNLKPLWIKLQGENRPLSADHAYDLSCEVVGSKPIPSITWWKGSTPMRNTREITSADGNTTTSILKFIPSIDDKGKFLSCRAEQTVIPDSGIEDGWKLDIYHIPVVSLEFGTNLNTTSIREGADVYFECNIKSNPWVYRVSWRHKGHVLDNNVPEGIIVANQSLVLQNVSRARSGLYTCVGSNREGDGESNSVNLDIKFAPICRPGQIVSYSIGRNEPSRILCEVEANPVNVNFTWKVNTTNLITDLPVSSFGYDKLRSVANYKPITEYDFGTLLCWGSNEIGAQSEPCIYHIKPAGKPDPLTNCTLLNQTSYILIIDCIEGFNGGLTTEYIADVYVTGTKQLITSIKSSDTLFVLDGLEPGMIYDIELIAINKKGKSATTFLHGHTLKGPEKQTDLSLAYSPTIENMRPFLGTILGIVAGMILIGTLIIVVVRIRNPNTRDRLGQGQGQGQQQQLPQQQQRRNDNDQSTNTALSRKTINASVDSLENNPDIIPQENKSDEKDDDEKCFEWLNESHSNIYATQALAEQNRLNSVNNSCSSSKQEHIIYGGLPTSVCVKENNYVQQYIPVTSQQQQQKQQYAHYVNPIGNLQHHQPQTALKGGGGGCIDGVNFSELPLGIPQPTTTQHQIHNSYYMTATLGRPKACDHLRDEPKIFSQIDLAHHQLMAPGSKKFYPKSIMKQPLVNNSLPPLIIPPPTICEYNNIMVGNCITTNPLTTSTANTLPLPPQNLLTTTDNQQIETHHKIICGTPSSLTPSSVATNKAGTTSTFNSNINTNNNNNNINQATRF